MRAQIVSQIGVCIPGGGVEIKRIVIPEMDNMSFSVDGKSVTLLMLNAGDFTVIREITISEDLLAKVIRAAATNEELVAEVKSLLE